MEKGAILMIKVAYVPVPNLLLTPVSIYQIRCFGDEEIFLVATRQHRKSQDLPPNVVKLIIK